MKLYKQKTVWQLAGIIIFALLTSGNLYGQVVVGGSLRGVSDVAVGASGNIYATVTSASTLAILRPDGRQAFIGRKGAGSGELDTPYALVLDEDENIYVGDRLNSRIQKFNSSGELVSSFSIAGYPYGIARGADGRFCVSFSGGGAVGFRVYNSNFSAILINNATTNVTGAGNGQFNNPEGTAFDANGNIYIADRTNNRVQVFDNLGVHKFNITTKGAANLNLPSKVEVYNDKLYIGDQSTYVLHIYNLNGSFIESKSYASLGGSQPGVTFDLSGNLVVAADNSVKVVNPINGALLRGYGLAGNADGEVDNPVGIARMDNGNTVVLDQGNARVQIFSAEGIYQSKFPVSVSGAVDLDVAGDNIYISLVNTGAAKSIVKYNSSGAVLATFNILNLETTTKMAVDVDGNIWLSFPSVFKIRKYDGNITGTSAGTLLTEFGTSGTAAGSINNHIYAMEVYDGNLYIVDGLTNSRRLQYFETDAGVYQGTIAASAYVDQIAVGENFIFAHTGGNGNFVTEQRNLSDGSLVNTLGGNGLQAILDIGVSDMFYDGTVGKLYVAEDNFKNNRFKVLSLLPEIKILFQGEPMDSQIDLGSFAVGTTNKFKFTVLSEALQPVLLTGNPKVQMSGSPSFSTEQASLATTISASSDFKVVFEPTTTGNQTATFTIANNDFDEGNFSFSVKGFATGNTNQTIDGFTSIPSKVYGDAPVQLTATTSSGLPLVYTSSNTSVATITQSGGSYFLTIIGKGDTQVTAKQEGNATFKGVSKVLLFTVTPKPLTVTGLTVPDKVYDGTTTATTTGTAALAGVVAGDAADVSLSAAYSATFGGKNVGVNKAMNVSGFNLSGSAAGNYTLTQPAFTGNILAKVVTVTGVAVSDKQYDGNATATVTSGTLNGVIAGETAAVTLVGTASFSNSNAGVDKAVSDFALAGSASGNYSLTQPTGVTAGITKAPLTATTGDKTRVYGDANPQTEIIYTGFKNESSQVLNTAPVASFAATATATANAGTTHAITVSGGQDDNYDFIYANGALSITKATLTARAEDKSRKYGQDNPTLTIVYTGFKNGEDVNVLDATPTVTTAAKATSDAGQYAIEVKGGSDNNYSFEYVNGTLAIGKADQAITFGAISDKVFGASAFAASATSSSGLPVTLTAMSDHVSIAGTQVTLLKAGKARITASQAGDKNYNAAASVERTFCVNPAKPSISASFANSDAPVLTSSASSGNRWYLNNVAISQATNTTYTVKAAGVYQVQSVADECVSELSDKYAVVVTGDLAKIDNGIKAYPNPTVDFVTIEVTDASSFRLTNVSGVEQSVEYSQANGGVRLDVRHLAPGMYIIRAAGKAGNQQIKFIKK